MSMAASDYFSFTLREQTLARHISDFAKQPINH